jgi:hypothetical protein
VLDVYAHALSKRVVGEQARGALVR